MAQYDFKNLSPYDFEVLVHGLMDAELGVRLERFSPGRDQGIDLRYLTTNGAIDAVRPGALGDGRLVIQCKHYASSSFSTLLTNLRKERPKVDALNPQRYIIVTSARLTPERKQKILDLFSKHISGPGDVIGEAEVNALIERHPEVERRNFKLWLSSAEVLRALLHNDVFVRTQHHQTSIEKKIQLYVQNESFAEAQDLLREHHACIIAGVPGIGKTMLADMLLAEHVAEDFEPVVVSDDISEALELYVPERQQVF